MRAAQATLRDTTIFAWGLGGVALTFVEAILRLGARAYMELSHGLDLMEKMALLGTIGFFCYFEGYRALSLRFAPLVRRRAAHAAAELSGAAVWLAPAYAAGLYRAERGLLLRSWLGVGAIVIAVLIVRALPSPARGIVDCGVAAALTCGLLALLFGDPRGARG